MLSACMSELAAWCGAERSGEDIQVHGVAIDSRRLQPGQLFVALRGERADGHDFAREAIDNGAVALLVERALDLPVPQLVRRDCQAALGLLAKGWRRQCAARVLGVTGSNGKTTVKTLAAAILERVGPTHVNPGNLNNEIGLPLSLLALPRDARYCILEMGAGKPGDIAYLADIACPDIALVNNVAPAHLERMGSVEGVAETKGALYSALAADGIAIINADDAFAARFAERARGRRIIHFGLEQPAEVWAESLELGASSSRFVLRTAQGQSAVNLPLAGRHNVLNALAAAAMAMAAGATLEACVGGLVHASAIGGRLRRLKSGDGWTLIDDSYNANPASTAAAIQTLGLEPGRRWLVLGDMAELGAEAVAMHREIGELARQRGVERLYTIGRLSHAASDAFGEDGVHFADRESLIEALAAALAADVTVLVKGSRSAGMDAVVRALLPAGEVDHAA
jgi:UDP-N-acetylmuramoyl-tripeptide--D-alanyl-D-alanine ligase